MTIPPHVRQAVFDTGLPPRDLRVYVVLCDELTREYRPIKHGWLARQTSLTRPHIVHALHRLTDRGYLESGPRDGSLRTYRLAAA